MGKIVGGLSCGKITHSPANGQTGARLSHLDREKSGIFGRKPPLIRQKPPVFPRFSARKVRKRPDIPSSSASSSFFPSNFGGRIRRFPFCIPFFVGVRGKLGVALACGRPTSGAASPMKPKGSFSFACSSVILPAFSLSARGRGRSVRRAEGNGGVSSGNARKSFAMLPDARLEKGTKRWDDEGLCFEIRRSARESPPLFCRNSRER